MARRKDIDFQQWVEENNFSEDDLQYIQKCVRNRTLRWFFISCIPGLNYFTLPLFIQSWAFYKAIKQRTFDTRPGFFFSLYSVAMFITFILIIPAIIYFIVRKTYTAGINGLIKKGLVGVGEQSIALRQQWAKICKVPRIICIFISAAAAAGMYILSTFSSHDEDPLLVAIVVIFCFFLVDSIGLIISSIVNNIRYKRYLSNE